MFLFSAFQVGYSANTVDNVQLLCLSVTLYKTFLFGYSGSDLGTYIKGCALVSLLATSTAVAHCVL